MFEFFLNEMCLNMDKSVVVIKTKCTLYTHDDIIHKNKHLNHYNHISHHMIIYLAVIDMVNKYNC